MSGLLKTVPILHLYRERREVKGHFRHRCNSTESTKVGKPGLGSNAKSWVSGDHRVVPRRGPASEADGWGIVHHAKCRGDLLGLQFGSGMVRWWLTRSH